MSRCVLADRIPSRTLAACTLVGMMLLPPSVQRQWVEERGRGWLDVTVYHLDTRKAFATDGERLWALDPESGEVRWEYAPAAGLEGVVSAGNLALVASGGTVLALDGTGTG